MSEQLLNILKLCLLALVYLFLVSREVEHGPGPEPDLHEPALRKAA